MCSLIYTLLNSENDKSRSQHPIFINDLDYRNRAKLDSGFRVIGNKSSAIAERRELRARQING